MTANFAFCSRVTCGKSPFFPPPTSHPCRTLRQKSALLLSNVVESLPPYQYPHESPLYHLRKSLEMQETCAFTRGMSMASAPSSLPRRRASPITSPALLSPASSRPQMLPGPHCVNASGVGDGPTSSPSKKSRSPKETSRHKLLYAAV